MKSKICVIIGLLLSVSIVVIVNNNVDVLATPGEGGGNGDNGSICLDYNYLWNTTWELANVVHNDSIWGQGIRKGRAFGTPGDQWTSEYIRTELNKLNLEGVQKLQIGYINDDRFRNYTYSNKIETNDFSLSITHPTETYPYPTPIPITEIYPIPSGFPYNPEENEITHNYSFNDAKIHKLIDPLENRNTNWPFGGTYNNYHFNITCETLNDYNEIIGNVSYIENDDSIPEFQDGMVYIIDEKEEYEEKIANITNATGCILIHNNSIGTYQYQYAASKKFSVVRVNENDNLTNITNMLNEGELMIVDNVLNTEILTFTYNLTEQNCLPTYDYMFLEKIRDPCETNNQYDDLGDAKWAAKWLYWINYFPPNFSYCHGFILYDSFDTHFMSFAIHDWDWFGSAWVKTPVLPMFSVNYSIGNWLTDNMFSILNRPRASGYLNQEYKQQTPESPGVEAYNVVGYRNITISPNDNTIILSNRYDGFWGETVGDSGLGAGIVLGIAKYFNDYNIQPKYNLTFLMTTGEEYGMRGAMHFNHTHTDENYNYTLWIGTDQLGMNQENLNLSIGCGNPIHNNIISVIINETDYKKRNNYKYGAEVENRIILGTEAKVWDSICDTIVFGKDTNDSWRGYHRAGANYTKGDVLSDIDRNDANITFELVWNVTKYFCVDPDCWFENLTNTTYDSPDDEDNLPDSYNISYTIKTIMPNDLVMVNASLKNSSGETVVNYKINYTINTSGIQDTITLTVPEGEEAEFYNCTIDLYNSTGRINEILGINPQGKTKNYYSSDYSYLYPINSDEIIPNYNSVTSAYSVSGVGCSSNTLSGNVVSGVSQISQSQVYVLLPNNNLVNYQMDYQGENLYEYAFNNAWQNGQYSYCIWGEDENGNTSVSEWHTFNVSAMADVSICTVEDTYTSNEIVNITDPPGSSQSIGYELLDDNQVLRIWNGFDSYYFNMSNGVQFTNHKDEYWSHNVLMLGYYNNDEWNLIYRTDELSGFNKNISTDDETFVNVTLWKDLTYQGYSFRLAIRYYLSVDDNELTIIPYIKNLGQEIPYMLGFAWELKDIKIDNTPEGDYIEINGSSYYLNTSIDETYTDLIDPCYYIREDKTGDTSESLHLRWDENLNYKVKVKPRDGQYNAPVTLGIKIGTLDVGQEKYTSLFWYDTSQVTYYFNNYFFGETWANNPSYMVDGNTGTYASTSVNGDVELCTSNTCNGSDLGIISKLELRVYGYYSGNNHSIILRPVFNGNDDLNNHTIYPGSSPGWTSWVDITNDWPVGSPPFWSWTEVKNLACDVEAKSGPGFWTLYCSKVEMRVNYNKLPVISNPYPADNSTGIPLTPVLNITVYDPEGGCMNISWLSNSSGSWQVFGTNNSIGNGTYHQTFANASVNGQWWYWKVNVNNGNSISYSNVYKFYTGNQSMNDNTGSYPITGYLLIQVQYYNTSLEAWVLANDTVNETSPRTINVSDQLGLDTVFNGKVSTNNLLNSFGSGTYRVYVAFRDPYGNVLVCDDDSLMEATYEFTLS